MTQDKRTTDELEHLISNICKNEIEIEIIRKALNNALQIYQWEYQNTSTRKKVTLTKELNDALTVVKKNLAILGQDTLLENLDDVFGKNIETSTKSNILSIAKQDMQQYCLTTMKSFPNNRCESIAISKSRYENEFGKLMGKAFVEWCETFPLDEAPVHFDMYFEPPIY